MSALTDALLHQRRLEAIDAELAQLRRDERAAAVEAEPAAEMPKPTSAQDRSGNALRPSLLADIIGQVEAKETIQECIEASKLLGRPLDHVLLVGPSGCGKSTFANAIANELDVDCYQVEAPISHETLLELREVMRDGDVLFLDEVHMQCSQDRRGASASTSPETIYQVLEDRKIISGDGVLDYPHITMIGATTDPGLLPIPFQNRFPLQPQLTLYGVDELREIARMNADRLGIRLAPEAEQIFAGAARHVPRQINNYVKNAELLSATNDGHVDEEIADKVIRVLNRTTRDGLTQHMQDTLKFLYQRGRRERADGTVTYQAGVGTIATAIGLSRDVKAVAISIEPFLIQVGFLQVGSGGRVLTDAGIQRAKELLACS
jgi:Holliday junction DNA helicase RuvB